MKFYLRVAFSLYFWASAGAAAAAANDELPSGRAGPACSGSRSRIGVVATDDRRPAVSALSTFRRRSSSVLIFCVAAPSAVLIFITQSSLHAAQILPSQRSWRARYITFWLRLVRFSVTNAFLVEFGGRQDCRQERRPELFTSAPDFVPFRVRNELDDQRTGAAGTVLGGLRLTDPMGSVDIARLQLNSEHSTQVDRHTRRLLVSRLSHAVEVETISTRILFDVVNGLSLSFDDFPLLTYLLLELLNLSVPRFEFFFEDVSQRLTDSTVTKAGHHGALQGFLGDRRFF